MPVPSWQGVPLIINQRGVCVYMQKNYASGQFEPEGAQDFLPLSDGCSEVSGFSADGEATWREDSVVHGLVAVSWQFLNWKGESKVGKYAK